MASYLQRLLGHLNRVFDKDPHQFLALRVDYNGSALTWTVADAALSLVSDDGWINLSIPLAAYTIASLVTYLSQINSLTISGMPSDGTENLSALTLVEGSNSSDNLNGDCIYAYTSLLWAFLGAMAAELYLLRQAILALPLEMSTTTADGEWLDFIGAFYNVPRLPGEPDEIYGPRIPAEVVSPISNGVGIAQAITYSTGQPATITDVIEYGPAVPEFNGAIEFDGSHYFNASAALIYGLFDAAVGFDPLNSGLPAAFATAIALQIYRLKMGGMQLRNLTIGPSVMSDTVRIPSDGLTGAWTSASTGNTQAA